MQSTDLAERRRARLGGEAPLLDRHAVVTGGSRGLGLGIARELARLGADLTLLGRDPTRLDLARRRLEAEFGGQHGVAALDIRDGAAIRAALDAAASRLGPPAILVNNAGVADSQPFPRMEEDHWREMIEVNLTGTFLACRAATPLMIAAGFGRIVNIASTAGQRGYAYVAAYCAAKHGVIGLTRALAVELARKNITVNAVCPGYADTDMTRETIANIVAKTGRAPQEVEAELTKSSPQGRLVTPEEVGRAVAFLCLPEAAAITGQAISVSGGETMP